MNDQAKCVCGCTGAEHGFVQQKSYCPESRRVEIWLACIPHNCFHFQPSCPNADEGLKIELWLAAGQQVTIHARTTEANTDGRKQAAEPESRNT